MQPSDKALVPFVSVDHMMQLVHHVGLPEMIRRIADAIENDQPERRVIAQSEVHDARSTSGSVVANAIRRSLQQRMDIDAGVLRSAESLVEARTWIDEVLTNEEFHGSPRTEDWEATNVITVARVLVEHAWLREETRGSHWREDHPDTEESWRVRLVTTMDHNGVLRTERQAPEWIPGRVSA
jgi:L-aspartate oxidase